MKIIESSLPHNGAYTRRSVTTEIILHHAEAKSASVEDINRWHNARGWNGIGYNYYIRKDGSIYRGRPEWAVGSHAAPHNSVSIGICCEGSYMTETMPAAQLAALKWLLRDIMGRWGKLTLLRHKDVNATDCPGTRFPWAEVKKYNLEDDEDMPNINDLTDAQIKQLWAKLLAPLKDNDASQYSEQGRAWCEEKGIVQGAGGGNYQWEAPLTREDMCVMLYRFAQLAGLA